MRNLALFSIILICSLSASLSKASELVNMDNITSWEWDGQCRSEACSKKVDRFEFVADDGGVCITYHPEKAYLYVTYDDGEVRRIAAPDIYNIDMSGEPDKERRNIKMGIDTENICAQAISAKWSLTQYSSDGSVTTNVVETSQTLPPKAICWAEVPNTIELGTLSRGDTMRTTVPLKFWGDRVSHLNLTSQDIRTDAEHNDALHLGGGEDVIVNILNQPQNWWFISSDNSEIELEVTVDKNAETGSHTSILTATLDCE